MGIKRIHIVGSGPRTGTSLLMEMMINSFVIDMHPRHEARITKCPPSNGKVFLTKSPKDILVAGKHLRFMKHLYIIFVMRDPRDSAVSFHGKNAEQFYGDLRYWKNFMPYFEKIIDHPRVILIKYEELVTDPDAIQQEIARRLPFLEIRDTFSNFHRNANPDRASSLALKGLRKVDAGSIGNWRNHRSRILGQMEKYGSISDDLIRYGYEKDIGWMKELEGIEPDFSDTYFSPFMTKRFIRKKQYFRNLKAIKLWFCHTSCFLEARERLRRLIRINGEKRKNIQYPTANVE